MDENPQETMYCANHPRVETSLRCSQCNKPICAKCAVLTPTGYKCKECIKGQQQIFDTTVWVDYPLALITSLVLSTIASLITQSLGFFIILLAPLAGTVIAEGVRFVTRHHRSPALYWTAVAGSVLGCLPEILVPLWISTQGLPPGSSPTGLASSSGILWNIVYLFLSVSAMYSRLSGIQLKLRS